MKVAWDCHLVFGKNGISRMTKGAPDLRAGEFAVRIKLNVPKSIFERVYPEAKITVPESAVIEPKIEIVQ